MVRVKCVVKYDGRDFYGFQVQNKQRTVQGEIQKAIRNVTNEDIVIHGSGRTDRKVHANGQVFHFDSEKDFDDATWKRAINHFLPSDIYIVEANVVDDDFHARYSAKSKTYYYLINTQEYEPLSTNYVYQYNRPLDIELMKEAAILFLGEHNFIAFCANDEDKDTIRLIEEINIANNDGVIRIEFKGDGFLRYMVRFMVGTLIFIGNKRITKNYIIDLFASNGSKQCLYRAKPQGLYLDKVFY